MVTFLEIVCLLLACWAAYLSFYRPPNFDWKESFRFSLSADGAPDIKLYPPFSGMKWDTLDEEILRQRLQYSLSSLRMFGFHKHRKAVALADYLEHEFHVVVPEAEDIASYIRQSHERLLFFCTMDEVHPLLVLLHQHPGMRDVLYALILVDPVFDDQWMEAHFSQDELDAEANAPIPYIFLFSEGEKEIPNPKPSQNGWRSICCIDLGCPPPHSDEAFASRMSVLLQALYS